METAVCIARSTRLVGRHQSIVQVSGSSAEGLEEQFNEFAGAADSAEEGQGFSSCYHLGWGA